VELEELPRRERAVLMDALQRVDRDGGETSSQSLIAVA
jgi:hypothetical protein